MAGAIFDEVAFKLHYSVFVADAVFGAVQVSLFVVGAVSGETWNGSRSANCCIFPIKNACGERKK